MASKEDVYFMVQAHKLAEKGRGTTSPNPMVGAVVVKNRSVVGQGFHLKAGTDHAEIVALKEAGEKAAGATLYVTMEPCCHYGKTPPCTEAIIQSGIQRVVAASNDDNPLVNGKGMERLKEAGIETETGILESQVRKLNESYCAYIKTGLPFVTVKLAVTLDGKIADSDGNSAWITGPETRKRVHLWRSWSDAVMVGVGTVLSDNPKLTVRDAEGTDPLRIIVDSTLRTPADAHVLDDTNVLIATTELYDREKHAFFEKQHIEILVADDGSGKVSIPILIKKLGERQVTSLLCEGGAALATALLKERRADKIIMTIAPKLLGSGMSALGDFGIKGIDDALELKNVDIECVENDVIVCGYPDWHDK